MRAAIVLALGLQATAHVCAQNRLLAARGNGDLLGIDTATGAASFFASTGFSCNAGVAEYTISGRSCYGRIYLGGGSGAQASEILVVGGSTFSLTGMPGGYEIRGMAGEWEPYVLLSTPQPSTVDLLGRIALNVVVVIGPTGQTDLEALAIGPGGLYAVGTGGGGRLYSLDSVTGFATFIGGGTFGSDTYGLEFLADGTLLAAGVDLRTVDTATGATSLIGPTGFDDIRTLMLEEGPTCYADCNCGGPPPMLNVADFTCFLLRFVSGDPYANCDQSTTQPVLNVADFTCFLQQFAAGCP
jgi:hypothetical protein